MQYKKLDPKDFTTGYGSNTTFVNSPSIESKSGNRSGTDAEKFNYTQIANIILGNRLENLNTDSSLFPTGNLITIYSFKRNEFKESIHIKSFRVDGIEVDLDSLAFCKAGRVYKQKSGASWWFYPDIGFLIKSGLHAAPSVTFCSEEIITTSHVYIRARNKEFNYSTNPSFSDIKGNLRFRESNFTPVVYITTVGLYNDNGDLLAVAKVPTPIEKTFEKEVLIQVQLDF